jgi:SET and MYND domain-containing protein 4
MQHLWSSGSSITCQMALRAISQKSVQYFLSLKNELQALGETINYSKTDTLPVDDYRRLFILVTHEKDRGFEDKFHRFMMACFLTYCIKLGGFFQETSEEK